MNPFMYNACMRVATKRKGKWGEEEEAYTNKIIEAFNTGTLALSEVHQSGQLTLRAYLAEKLNCDPMRITKKFTGASCLGKRVYHKGSGLNGHIPTEEEVKAMTKQLSELEAKFEARLDHSARKKREYEMRNREVDLLQLQERGIPVGQAMKSFENMKSSSTSEFPLSMRTWIFPQRYGIDKSTHEEACKAAQAAYDKYIEEHNYGKNDAEVSGGHLESSSSSSTSSANQGREPGGDSEEPSPQAGDGRMLSTISGWTNMHRKISMMEMASRDDAYGRGGMNRSDSIEGGTSMESTSIKGGSSDSNNEDDSGGANSDSTESDSNEDRSEGREGLEPPSKRVKGERGTDRITADHNAASALLGLGK